MTEIGQQHPVTAGLHAEGEPDWGRWFRQLDVESQGGQVLMTGVADRPLLVLNRVGEGRVAQLLSDHAWLWARGYEGGGPQALLLRRLVHWLMKEPQLEEEQLRATTRARRSWSSAVAQERGAGRQGHRSLRAPSTRCASSPAPMASPAAGSRPRRTASTGSPTGDHTAYASPRPIAPVELADMRATPRGDGTRRRGHRRHGPLAG